MIKSKETLGESYLLLTLVHRICNGNRVFMAGWSVIEEQGYGVWSDSELFSQNTTHTEQRGETSKTRYAC